MGRIYRFIYLLLLIILFLAEFFHPITAINVDLGRHLLFGKIIVTTHHVPTENLLAYTYKDFPYINTSWFTDVIYYYLFGFGGFNALLIVNTALVAIAFGTVVWYAAKKYFLSLATLFSITLYVLLLGLRPDVRPEVMSMVCMSLFLCILFLCKKGDRKLLWALVPIEILWVNLHIYFFVGPLLILLFLFDDLIVHHFRFSSAKAYVYVFAGTLVATCINPNSIAGAFFPVTVLFNYGFPVAENQSILALFAIYHSNAILLPLFAIMLLFIVLFLTRKKTQPIDWLLSVVFSIGAIIIFRNVLLFVFATFIPFVKQVNLLALTYRPFIKRIPTMSYALLYPLSFLLLFLFIVSCIRVNGFGFGTVEQGKGAVDFFLTHRIRGPIYNNFDIGDYLSYRIYPQLVFVENRPEAYPSSFFKNLYIPMQESPNLFKQVDEKYHFNAIVLSYWNNTPWGNNLFRYLVNDSDFKLVYLDPYTVILLRNNETNRGVINTYLITEKNVRFSKKDFQSSIYYLFFFEKAGWTQQERLTLDILRKGDENLCLVKQYPIEKTFISNYITAHNITTSCAFSTSNK